MSGLCGLVGGCTGGFMGFVAGASTMPAMFMICVLGGSPNSSNEDCVKNALITGLAMTALSTTAGAYVGVKIGRFFE